MPSLSFVLPHWLYWLGLIAIPLAAMYLIDRNVGKEEAKSKVSIPIAYFMWLTAGFIGIHRFYLRNKLGFIYIPIFVAILFANYEGREARNIVSNMDNEVISTEFLIERAQNDVNKGKEGAQAKLEKLQQQLIVDKKNSEDAHHSQQNWQDSTQYLALTILALLLFDATQIPKLYRRCLEVEDQYGVEVEYVDVPCDVDYIIDSEGQKTFQFANKIHSKFTDTIDRINEFTGQFVAYWSIIAVIVYYYEVIARYVFNSPTNWAHESMFLMFGMQYLLAGGYVLRNNGHVRVDVFYVNFSARTKAAVDVATSFFFFLFAGALTWTGWTFFNDSFSAREVSFTEWAIQYYPIKFAIPLGAALLFLQGFAWLMKDIALLLEKKEN